MNIPADSLDQHIIDRVFTKAMSSGFMSRLRRDAGDRESVRRSKAEKELVAAETNLEQLLIDLGEGELSRASWKVVGPRAEARVETARDRLARLVAAKRVLPEALDRPEELRQKWPKMTPGEQRAVVTAAMIDHFVVGPGRIGRTKPDPAGRVPEESIRYRA